MKSSKLKSKSHRNRSQFQYVLTDSGASHHVTGLKWLVKKIYYNKPVSISAADGPVDKPGYFCDVVKNDLGMERGIYHE